MTSICDQSVTVETVTAAVLESMESAPRDATEWLMAIGIIVALGIGVGGWIYDAYQRRQERERSRNQHVEERERNQKTFAVLLYEDVDRARNQCRDIRALINDYLVVEDGSGSQVIHGTLENPFLYEIESLLSFSPLFTVESSSPWAEAMEHETVLRICKIRSDTYDWNQMIGEIKRDPERAFSDNLSTIVIDRLDKIDRMTRQVSQELSNIMFRPSDQ